MWYFPYIYIDVLFITENKDAFLYFSRSPLNLFQFLRIIAFAFPILYFYFQES